MKRAIVYEEGMLVGELELMTGTNRCSDCISSGNGVFCSLLRIPSEVRCVLLMVCILSALANCRAGILGLCFRFCKTTNYSQK
jgi:hypothetical protein